MNTSMPSAAHLEKLQLLTQSYAQFSRNRAGLGYLVLLVCKLLHIHASIAADSLAHCSFAAMPAKPW